MGLVLGGSTYPQAQLYWAGRKGVGRPIEQERGVTFGSLIFLGLMGLGLALIVFDTVVDTTTTTTRDWLVVERKINFEVGPTRAGVRHLLRIQYFFWD